MKQNLRETAPAIDCATGFPFQVGDIVLIRTVTMYQVGRVAHVANDFITLTEASWVAEIGRLGEALESGKLREVEKAPEWICVGRGAIVDIFPWRHELPKATAVIP